MKIKMDEKNDTSDLFAEYMWMGEMEKFDEEVEAEFEEQEFIRSCIEQLLDEEEEQTVFFQPPQQSTNIPQGQCGAENKNEYGFSNGNTNRYNNQYSSQQVNAYHEVPDDFQELYQNMAEMHVSSNPQNHLFNYFLEPEQHGDTQKTQILNAFQYKNGNQVPKVPLPKNSTLNPNAVPYVMNPHAKEFVPRFNNKTIHTTHGFNKDSS